MAIERIWERQGPEAFTADGGADGLVTVASVLCFKVKQKVTISSATQDDILLEVKRVLSATQLRVGPIKDKTHPQKPIHNLKSREDISAYTTADGSTIRAGEQKKVRLSPPDIIQALYEQEPTVGLRNFLVDKLGNGYTEKNPLPVQLSDGSINIGTVEANIEVHTTHLDDSPVPGRVHDSMRIGGLGADEADVNSDDELLVSDAGLLDLPQLPDDIGTAKETITDSENEIIPVTGQQRCVITSLGAGKVHYSFDTGVDTTFNSLSKGDQLEFDGENSVFLIRGSGSSDVQVDREIKT